MSYFYRHWALAAALCVASCGGPSISGPEAVDRDANNETIGSSMASCKAACPGTLVIDWPTTILNRAYGRASCDTNDTVICGKSNDDKWAGCGTDQFGINGSFFSRCTWPLESLDDTSSLQPYGISYIGDRSLAQVNQIDLTLEALPTIVPMKHQNLVERAAVRLALADGTVHDLAAENWTLTPITTPQWNGNDSLEWLKSPQHGEQLLLNLYLKDAGFPMAEDESYTVVLRLPHGKQFSLARKTPKNVTGTIVYINQADDQQFDDDEARIIGVWKGQTGSQAVRLNYRADHSGVIDTSTDGGMTWCTNPFRWKITAAEADKIAISETPTTNSRCSGREIGDVHNAELRFNEPGLAVGSFQRGQMYFSRVESD